MGQSAAACRRLLPLLWEPGDACDVRGARGTVLRVGEPDILVDVDGLPFWVPSSALELLPLPASSS